MNTAFHATWAQVPLSRLVARIAEITEVDQVLRIERRELEAIVHERLGSMAQAQRAAAGKQTGTVRFDSDGYTVIADLPKRTEYDQTKLAAAVEALRKWGENPADYVSFEIKVSEAKYQAWPPAVRALFEPARTVKTGKPSYQFQPSGVASHASVDSAHLTPGAP